MRPSPPARSAGGAEIPHQRAWPRPGLRYMVGSALAFSGMAACAKALGERLPSQEIVFVRALISLLLSLFLLRRARVPIWGERHGLLLLRGALGFTGLSCFFYAVTQLPLAVATVIQYLHPIFTALLAGLLLREVVGRGTVQGIAAAFLGVLLVAKPGALGAVLSGGGGLGVGGGDLPTTAVVVAVCGAAASAGAYVAVRKLAATEHPHVIVLYFPLVAVPAALPALAWGGAMWPRGVEWLLLLAVGVLAQIGQVALTRGLRTETAGRATALSYLQVAFAAGWGVLCFAEVPDRWTVAGGLLVLAGCWRAALRR